MKPLSTIILLPLVIAVFAAPDASARVPGSDTPKGVDSLNRLAERSLERNLDSAKYLADRALTRAIHLQYMAGQFEARNTLSKVYFQKEDYEKMLDQYFNMVDLYPDHDIPHLVQAYDRITQFFFQIIKDYNLAEKYLNIMIRVARQSDIPSIHGQVFLCQAKYYLARKQCDTAIRYGFLALPCFSGAKDLNSECGVHKLLGDAFVQLKKYGMAEYNYRQAIGIANRTANLPEIAILYTRIAHIYQVTGVNGNNLKYNLAALRLRMQTGPPRLISSSLLNVGEAYWLLGKKDSAYHYLQESLQLAEQIRSTDQLETVYSQLSDFARAEQRYADALKYFRICFDYRTKMHNDRNRSEIRILEANRSIRASEGQVDLLRQETTIQDLEIRNRRVQILLFEVALLIMLTLIFFSNTVARKNRRRKNELQELNNQLAGEIQTRLEAESRLRRSEELHRFLAENTSDVISLFDARMHRLYISPSCEKFYGYSADEILGMEGMQLIASSYQAAVEEKIREMFRTGRSVKTVYAINRKDSSGFWAEATYNPVTDPVTREVKHVIAIVRDITERIRYAEELSENARQKEYLLREIHNRVKNNFAILVSLMNMQCDESANPELTGSLSGLQLRVRTMSLVHEQLYQTQEISTIPFDNYLRHLTLIISSSFNNRRINLQTETHPCSVPIEMALPLGLITNELITNAYKYAFPGERTGNIKVRLYPENDRSYCISITDDGIGLPQDFNTTDNRSMGSQIVQILVQQIEATLEVAGNGGACFRILFSPSQAEKP